MSRLFDRKYLRLGLLVFSPWLVSCDPYHKDKCEWYLEPEPRHINTVEEGWVSLCARNFVVMKQKCHLKSRIDFAKAVSGKVIRFSSIKTVEDGPYPREILSVKACQPEKN